MASKLITINYGNSQYPPWKHVPWKLMVGRLVSFRNGPFLGYTVYSLVFEGVVACVVSKTIELCNTRILFGLSTAKFSPLLPNVSWLGASLLGDFWRHMGVNPKIGVGPQNGWWKKRKTLLKLVIWGYPYFWKHLYCTNMLYNMHLLFERKCQHLPFTQLIANMLHLGQSNNTLFKLLKPCKSLGKLPNPTGYPTY